MGESGVQGLQQACTWLVIVISKGQRGTSKSDA